MYLFQAGICKVIIGSFMNVPLFLDLMVIWEAIYFVNEHLKVDVRIDFVGPGHCEMQPVQSLDIVILSSEKEKIYRKKQIISIQIPL